MLCLFRTYASVNQLRPPFSHPVHSAYSSNSNDIIDCPDGCHHRGKYKQNRVRLPRDYHRDGWFVTERDIRVEQGDSRKERQKGVAVCAGRPHKKPADGSNHTGWQWASIQIRRWKEPPENAAAHVSPEVLQAVTPCSQRAHDFLEGLSVNYLFLVGCVDAGGSVFTKIEMMANPFAKDGVTSSSHPQPVAVKP